MSQSAQPLPPVPSSPIASAFQGRDTIRWVRGVLWRGKFLILAVLLLLLVPTILYLQQVTPLYTATAEVLIESSENNDTLLDRNNPYRQRLNEAAVMTESEVLTSTPLALRVIEKLGLDNDPEYNARLRKPSAFAGFMADALSLQWLPEEWRPAPSDRKSVV